MRLRRCGSASASTRRSADEVDAFAAYCADTDGCYFMALEEAARDEMRLRLGPTRNNQVQGVRWARDYEFAARLGPLVGP